MEESDEFLNGLKSSLQSFIAYQEMSDQQMEDIINNEETGIFHKYDFFMLSYLSLNPEYLSFVVEKTPKFVDFVINALINYQDDQFEQDPQRSCLFKEFLIINFREIPYTNQVYRFMDKIDTIQSSENTLFLECQNLFYKLIMLQGEVILITKSKSMEKFRIYHCGVCNRGYLEENNLVMGKTRLKQSKLPTFVRNVAIDDEYTDQFTGYLKYEKLRCICESRKLNPREKVLITYQDIVIKLSNQNRLTVTFEGNVNEALNLGQRICVTGYLINHFDRPNKNGRCEGSISMYAINCSHVTNRQHEVLRTEIMTEVPQPDSSIKKDIQNKNRLIRSFCPKIKKKYFAKLFMLLGLISGTSYMRNNYQVRSQIYMLFVGPSGSHKFDLMRAASNIVKESKYIPLVESHGDDFVFMINRKGDSISFEAGPLLMGNREITFVHDINLVHSKNKELLTQILLTQKVIKNPSDGAKYEIPVNTSLIASCEPLYRAKAGKDKNGNCRVIQWTLRLRVGFLRVF